MVNITCTNIIFKDVNTAQVCLLRLSFPPKTLFIAIPGLETGLETADQQQQDQQCLSNGEFEKTLDETEVGLYLIYIHRLSQNLKDDFRFLSIEPSQIEKF